MDALGLIGLTVAEAAALAGALRVAVPLIRKLPQWQRLPDWARPLVVHVLAALAALVDNLATGKPALLSVLLAVSAGGAAMASYEVQKGLKPKRGP